MRRRLGIAFAVTLLAASAASQLTTTPASDLLVREGSDIGRAGALLDERFGGEPIVVSLESDLANTLEPRNLVALLELEGRIAKLDGVRSVYGPGTFINQTIVQSEALIERELGDIAKTSEAAAEGARAEALRRGRSRERADAIAESTLDRALGAQAGEYRELLVRLGSVGAPALSNTSFVSALVFGPSAEPKMRFRWLFPDREHALVLVRLDPSLGESETLALGDRLRRLVDGAKLREVTIEVAGFPLLAAGLERETRSEILRLAPVAIGVMALLLLLVLRQRRGRFVPLVLALGGTLVAVGLSWPLGLGLSVATVAALPVVLGLGLDFAVQLQARFWKERAAGRGPGEAAAAARAAVGPTLGLAAGAMTVAFAVLVTAGVPLLDRLGAVLALGTLSTLGFALLAGPALLVVLDRGAVPPIALGERARPPRWAMRPIVLAVIGGLAIGGLAISGQTRLQTDLPKLAPDGMAELERTEALQESLGTGGQVRVAIQGPDVTDPAVIRWLGAARDRVVEAVPELRPGPALSDLVLAGSDPEAVDRQAVDGILRLLPRYFVDAVLARDRRVAELTFGIPLVPVGEQVVIVDRIRAAMSGAPDGITVTTAGLVSAAAASTEELEGTRPSLLLLAAVLVGLVLFVVWRDILRVVVVLLPPLVAAGLAALALVLADLELSPLGAALEPLVLAVGLEFALLLDMRYREARAAGRAPALARAEATREIGGAVALSAGTVAAGFAVLVASRLPLLSQLGWLVALELALCLVAALAIVPALCEWRDLASPSRPSSRRWDVVARMTDRVRRRATDLLGVVGGRAR